MIAKRIPSPKGGAGFAQLGAYVLNAKTGGDPASWTRLNAYILDAGHVGEKVAWSRVTNCQSDDPGWAVKEILAIQARNTRSRSDKNYHLVVSFPEGEKPTRAQLEDIEDRICAAIGFAEHQRVSAVHQNTDNWHLHVAINKVHPRTFRNAEPWYDHYRLQQCCAELEIRHGLTRTSHTPAPERRHPVGRAIGGRGGDFEAQQGGASFLRWVREQARPALLEARERGDWQALHRAAARYGLAIKPRGAGLVIGHRGDRRLHVKASDVDRVLAIRPLTETLGPFQAPDEQAQREAAETQYDAGTPKRTGVLYDAFCNERERAMQARAVALATLRHRHQAYADELRRWYRERLRQERASGLSGAFRRDALGHLRDMQREDRAARIRREAKERREVRVCHPIPTWQGYLEAEAARGNGAALAALRGRTLRRAQVQAQLLAAENADEARHVIRRHLRPTIRRDGRVIYRVSDGGVVSDEARVVRVNQVTVGAAFLALSLASERFGQRALTVQGTDEFRAQVAVLAGQKDLAVTFADPKLEVLRVLAASERSKVVDRGRDPGNTLHR
ncbi:TraI/MobA(P) family conjugative relaxase [Limobrevibacterium gyesilva]|uniref:Relaxase/mobilization nuclease domain-containing protein n=1 Tax=Limobrevibacterium gyesilva TaxID=2991712 RepID=A0AA41YLU6_9PROT|nr:TraI/MobA(P) family conjugative relaxase [Limobrevibacterium gyesilva]MCW3476241.1 relaxase/mobilization nuclease domain-containing protein [Limobrevibacterium gyesilva]